MRVPPLYNDRSWQRFFAGMAIGAVISWAIFIYINGVFQEQQSILVQEQQDKIKKLEDDIIIWQEDYKNLNEQNIEKLLIQAIQVKITNHQKYDLDLLSVHETEDAVMEDLKTLKAKDLEVAFKNRELIKRVIENRKFTINDKKYRLEVKEMIIYTTIVIQLHINLDR
ncbi:sporulation protein [Bacillus sp. FJAT-27225]|uniref:sporulation membrane protein YtrI n=1 Tax=Bacillus sp. FJAT-27225 TaxID=1743144 RepID=UPI00080C2164|nr:sporulation membrane protein YtrI [Bacillus sp. FJAT-27225]OCA91372.1 sporulation protein [Bacillus sp. FJAT-27225]